MPQPRGVALFFSSILVCRARACDSGDGSHPDVQRFEAFRDMAQSQLLLGSLSPASQAHPCPPCHRNLQSAQATHLAEVPESGRRKDAWLRFHGCGSNIGTQNGLPW